MMAGIMTGLSTALILLLGVVLGELLIMIGLHKRWYGSYIIKRENLPFSKKLKERIKKGEIKL